MALPAALAVHPLAQVAQRRERVPAVLEAHHLDQAVVKDGLVQALGHLLGPVRRAVVVVQAPDVAPAAIGLQGAGRITELICMCGSGFEF